MLRCSCPCTGPMLASQLEHPHASQPLKPVQSPALDPGLLTAGANMIARNTVPCMHTYCCP